MGEALRRRPIWLQATQSDQILLHVTRLRITNFWWSNPVSAPLAGNLTLTIAGHLANPGEWSDWNGKNRADNRADSLAAVSKVQTVGLSFGGGCFFENGVTTSDGSGTLSSDFSVS